MSMPRLKGPQRREQLMEVGRQLFAERGYDATTTAAIAEAAGITEPVLYRHFANKKDMFKAILCDATDQMLAYWNPVLADIGDANEQIRRMGECFGEHIQQLRLLHRIVHGALATTTDPEIIEVLNRHYAQLVELVSKVLERGQQAGIFRNDITPAAAAWILITMADGHAILKLGLGLSALDEKIAVEVVLRGLRTGA